MRRKIPRKSPSEAGEMRSLKKKQTFSYELLNSINETPEFHDPYSELNLFLSQKIKQEIRHCCNSKKWSIQLQDQLLHKITPEFQKRFPKYRLGLSALKKTWERVHYFSSQIQGQKEALTQEGKLNLSFFIKENLKTASKLKNTCHLHPYHYAHQLAIKMGECIAVVDGIRPRLDQIARTIWLVQRHLIPKLAPEHFKSPYDENDKIDKLIVKLILEITAKHPQIPQTQLAGKVQARLIQLKELTTPCKEAQLKRDISELFSDKFSSCTSAEKKHLEKIPYHNAMCIEGEIASILMDMPHLNGDQLVCEVLDFFKKTRKILENQNEEEIDRKIQNWTLQGDMLLRWIRLDHASPLFEQVTLNWKKGSPSSFQNFSLKVLHDYLEKYPHLFCYAPQINLRIWIFLKYMWYTYFFSEETTTFDRFIKWHATYMSPLKKGKKEILLQLEKLCPKMLPLVPFDTGLVHALVFGEKEENSKEHEGQT